MQPLHARAHAQLHGTQALAAGRRERRRRRASRSTPPRGIVGERPLVPLAVVDLDQPLVDLDLERDGVRDRSAPSRARDAAGSTRPRSAGPRERGALRAASACARPTSVSGGSARPSSRPSRFASVWPWRTKRDHAADRLAQPSRADRTRRTWLGQVEVELPDDPPAGRRGRRAPRAGRPTTPAAARRRGTSVPPSGHQNSVGAGERAREHRPHEAPRSGGTASAGAAAVAARSSPPSPRRAARPRTAACARTRCGRPAGRRASGSSDPTAIRR